MSKLIFYSFAVFCLFGFAFANNQCSGQGTCDIYGNRAGRDGSSSCSGVCDCNPLCNSCPQLLSGCASYCTVAAYVHVPPVLCLGCDSFSAIVNTTYGPQYCSDVCIKPSLPAGIALARAQNGLYYISGSPTETLPTTTFTLIIKGRDFIAKATFALTVYANRACCPSTSTTGSRNATTGSRNATTGSRPATTGLTHATTARPATTGSIPATTSRPATTGSTPATTARPATTGPATTGCTAATSTTGATPSTTGYSCTVGYQECLTSETYHTCVETQSGPPAYGISQPCPLGTTCTRAGHYISCDTSTD